MEAMVSQISLAFWTLLVAWLGLQVYRLVYNVFFHPLRSYPGPVAAKATTWWKTYVEVVRKESFTDTLIKLHKQYGDVVRVGPNELHFANPSAYNDIYSSAARWDKEKALYESFGEDHSSFGFLTYGEAKQRKDVLQPLFSRRAVVNMQGLVRQNIDHLSEVLARNNEKGVSSDLFLAFRCFTMDTITAFCFAQSVNAIDAPGFGAPIIEAMEASFPTFILFRHFPLFRKIILSLPPWLAIRMSPETAGLTNLQTILGRQVKDVIVNPESLKDQPHPIVYHRLLDPEVQKGHPVPNATSLYEEAQALMFGGGDTVGNTLMVGFFHILSQPSLYQRLRKEVLEVWPHLNSPPNYETLEPLPLLTGAIKEALRMSPGVASPLLRVVPATGATISKCSIPGGTIVGISGIFVHNSGEIFKNPDTFDADRWLGKDASSLDQWLVAFSKGPRSCLGISLAWCELYIAFATMLRRFDMKIDGTTLEDLVWRDCFLPHFYGKHLRAWCQPVTT